MSRNIKLAFLPNALNFFHHWEVEQIPVALPSMGSSQGGGGGAVSGRAGRTCGRPRRYSSSVEVTRSFTARATIMSYWLKRPAHLALHTQLHTH